MLLRHASLVQMSRMRKPCELLKACRAAHMLLTLKDGMQATQQDMQTLSRSLQEMNAPEFLEVWLVLHLCRVGSLQVQAQWCCVSQQSALSVSAHEAVRNIHASHRVSLISTQGRVHAGGSAGYILKLPGIFGKAVSGPVSDSVST